jgi:purine nucleosidase
MTKRVFLDTDIGSDVDDCLALAFLLASPEIELVGVSCVYGDVELRARMIQKLLRLAGRDHIPITLGSRQTLVGTHAVYWGGYEGDGLLAADDPPLSVVPQHAVDHIIETVMTSPGEIHLLAIGPLTNVALAIRKEPQLVTALGSLVIMGGAARGPNRWHIGYAEHNIKCDPEAAQVVFGSGVPITLVPLDVTLQVRIDQAGVERIRAEGSAYHQAVADQVLRYPPFIRQGWTFLHDPLAAAVLIDPGLVRYEPLEVEVETAGRVSTGMTLMRSPRTPDRTPAQVALEVDAARFEQLFIDRVAAALPTLA